MADVKPQDDFRQNVIDAIGMAANAVPEKRPVWLGGGRYKQALPNNQQPKEKKPVWLRSQQEKNKTVLSVDALTKNPAFIQPIGDLVRLMGAGCLALEERATLTQAQKDAGQVPWPQTYNGWEKVKTFDHLFRDNQGQGSEQIYDSLHMSMYRKGNTTVCVTLPMDATHDRQAVRELWTEAKHVACGGEPESHTLAQQKMGEWLNENPDMILLGQSRGAAASLRMAKSLADKGKPIPPVIAIDPIMPPLWKADNAGTVPVLTIQGSSEPKPPEKAAIGHRFFIPMPGNRVDEHNMRNIWDATNKLMGIPPEDKRDVPVPGLVAKPAGTILANLL